MAKTRQINGIILTLLRYVNHGILEECGEVPFIETICQGNDGLFYLCDCGMIPADKGFSDIEDMYRMHGISLEGSEVVTDDELIEKFTEMSDMRSQIKETDRVAGMWFGDDRWYIFTANNLTDGDKKSEHESGLGFLTKDAVFDTGYAYHIIKL